MFTAQANMLRAMPGHRAVFQEGACPSIGYLQELKQKLVPELTTVAVEARAHKRALATQVISQALK